MPNPNRPLRVFLCHASGDKPVVRNLYKRLVKDGIDAWLDTEKLIPGQNWKIEIPKAVVNSDIVLVCLSSQSINKDGFVQKEIKFALDSADEKPDGTIFIIPIRLEDCIVPEKISQFHWVDLFLDNGYEKLLKALRLRAENIGAITSFSKSELDPFHQQAQDNLNSSQGKKSQAVITSLKTSTERNSAKKTNSFMSTYMPIGVIVFTCLCATSVLASQISGSESDCIKYDLYPYAECYKLFFGLPNIILQFIIVTIGGGFVIVLLAAAWFRFSNDKKKQS